MSRKHLLALTVVLPLIGASGTAFAGSTISDGSYWPDQARADRYVFGEMPAGWSLSRAQLVGTQRPEVPIVSTDGRGAARYRGGPNPRSDHF